ncbi:DUF2188 domain-containing protein [Microbacterium protaetiae]|uniref:DUF2188 domain-containing protein n=1 Tax=Microbacterium protaetiae TaxID=2509458 RepID=A0A4P6E9I0_9MICO|nr:DUF2188 domain-containing protein [Microbacterium protaetiae]QAY58750.1 DUF2188 domain-containing protein [Microbacterium protaetiae]
MTEGDIETFHEDGVWRNRIEGHQVLDDRFERKSDAVEAGRDLAQVLRVEHIVRALHGRIVERTSYGHVPRDIPG